MNEKPQVESAKTPVFTVRDFYESGRERLELKILGGESFMDRIVEEPILNRPGLALTGFLTDFEHRRVQVMGNAEISYLNSLGEEESVKRLVAIFDRRPALVVTTNSNNLPAGALEAAEKAGVVILTSSLGTRLFTHHSLFILDRLSAPRMKIYGTMMEVCGLGVLFEGAPGLGKSETALGLIKHGWALIADDLTCIRKDSALETLFGYASSATAGYMEIRGIGIIHIPSIFGVDALRGEKRLDLVLTFKPLDEVREDVDRIGQKQAPREILGVKIPNVVLPVSEGRDLVNLVETAAQQHKLIMAGEDPASQLSRRLHDLAAPAHN